MSIQHANDSEQEVSSNRVIGVTKGGKEVAVKRDKKTGMFRICFTAGGELPHELTGLFSNQHAVSTIQTYLAKQSELKA